MFVICIAVAGKAARVNERTQGLGLQREEGHEYLEQTAERTQYLDYIFQRQFVLKIACKCNPSDRM